MTKEYGFQKDKDENYENLKERVDHYVDKALETCVEKNKNQITVFICSRDKHKHNGVNYEHSTYVDFNGKCMCFYTDGYTGTTSEEVIGFLKFLGFEVFIVYSDRYTGKSEFVNTSINLN